MPFHSLNCGDAALRNLRNSIEESWKLLHKSLSGLYSCPGGILKASLSHREKIMEKEMPTVLSQGGLACSQRVCVSICFPVSLFSKYFSSLILQASYSSSLIGHALDLHCVPRLPRYLVHFHVSSRLPLKMRPMSYHIITQFYTSTKRKLILHLPCMKLRAMCYVSIALFNSLKAL